jgi:hypothetical protein
MRDIKCSECAKPTRPSELNRLMLCHKCIEEDNALRNLCIADDVLHDGIADVDDPVHKDVLNAARRLVKEMYSKLDEKRFKRIKENKVHS